MCSLGAWSWTWATCLCLCLLSARLAVFFSLFPHYKEIHIVPWSVLSGTIFFLKRKTRFSDWWECSRSLLLLFNPGIPALNQKEVCQKKWGVRHEVWGDSCQHTLAREPGIKDSGDDRVWRDPAMRVHVIVLLAVVLCAEISQPWSPSFQIVLSSFILLPVPLLSSAFPWPLCSSLVGLSSVLQMPPYRSRPLTQ